MSIIEQTIRRELAEAGFPEPKNRKELNKYYQRMLMLRYENSKLDTNKTKETAQ
jgi:hypothetical protein